MVRAIKIPDKFYKRRPFSLTEDELASFLSCYRGHIEDNGEVILHDLDISLCIRSHTGDCRLWYRDGTYITLDAGTIFMQCGPSVFWIDDIYEWMEAFVPTLYQKHIKYDNEVLNSDPSLLPPPPESAGH